MPNDERERIEPSDPNPQHLMEAYKELCTSYRAIDDFRAKLLGFLPLATGTGIYLLFDKLKDINAVKDANSSLIAAGVFGVLTTSGLFFYEIYGIKKCCALIRAGQKMEVSLRIKDGQFITRPQNVAFVINEPCASGVIYPAVIAAWTFFTIYFGFHKPNPLIPICVFIAGFVCTLLYDFGLRRRIAKSGKCDR